MLIQSVRQAISDAVDAGIAGVDGMWNLTCTPYVPDAVTVPHFYAGEVEIDVNNAYGSGGYDQARITCRVLVSRADDKTGQALLDELLSRTGTNSIRAALNIARGAPGQAALSGTCDDFSIDRIQGYRLYQVGDTQYFGAEIVVRVIGSGEGP